MKTEYAQISELRCELFKVEFELMALQSQLRDAQDLRNTLVDAQKISIIWGDPDSCDYDAKILSLTAKIDMLLSKINCVANAEDQLAAKLEYLISEAEYADLDD